MREANIEICPASDWLVLPLGSRKNICNSFRDCSIHLYEFLFPRINLRLPLSDFEVEVLRFLKVSPS